MQGARYASATSVSLAEGWSLERLTPPSRLFGANGLRTGPDGRIWQPEQRITLTEAIGCATTSGAVAVGAASRRGRIAAGYDADLVALGADPWQLPVPDIATARPVLTVSAGRVVFDDITGEGAR